MYFDPYPPATKDKIEAFLRKVVDEKYGRNNQKNAIELKEMGETQDEPIRKSKDDFMRKALDRI